MLSLLFPSLLCLYVCIYSVNRVVTTLETNLNILGCMIIKHICKSYSSQVHNILAEMVMGGMVLETNMNEIITQVDAQNKMEKSEVSPIPVHCVYDLILPPYSELLCIVCRHVCMLHPACYSPVTLWMLPTYS